MAKAQARPSRTIRILLTSCSRLDSRCNVKIDRISLKVFHKFLKTDFTIPLRMAMRTKPTNTITSETLTRLSTMNSRMPT